MKLNEMNALERTCALAIDSAKPDVFRCAEAIVVGGGEPQKACFVVIHPSSVHYDKLREKLPPYCEIANGSLLLLNTKEIILKLFKSLADDPGLNERILAQTEPSSLCIVGFAGNLFALEVVLPIGMAPVGAA